MTRLPMGRRSRRFTAPIFEQAANAIPPLRPQEPCETQEQPDLRTIPGPPDTEVARGLPDTAEAHERWSAAQDRAIGWVEDYLHEYGLDDEWRVVAP